MRLGQSTSRSVGIELMSPCIQPIRRSILFLAFACLASCAHYRPKPLEPYRSLRALWCRRLDDPRVLERMRVQNVAQPDSVGGWGRAQLLVAAVTLRPQIAEAQAVL